MLHCCTAGKTKKKERKGGLQLVTQKNTKVKATTTNKNKTGKKNKKQTNNHKNHTKTTGEATKG